MKKALSVLLAAVLILSVLPIAAFAGESGYSVYIYYDGLSDETAEYVSVTHEIIDDPFYVIPDNPDTVKEDMNFNGFYCSNTGKMIQIGESVPLSSFQEKVDGYYLYLSARFSKKEVPGITYTDKERYDVLVIVQSPDSPYDYLESANTGISKFTDTFSDGIAGQNVGSVVMLRTFTRYTRMGMNFVGYRSLLTGNFFELGDTVDLDKLAAPVCVGQELEEISDTEGYRVSLYEINDYFEPVFEYLGLVGGFIEPMYKCTINYYSPVTPKEDEEITGDPMQFFAYEGSDVFTMAMADFETPMELTCQPDYMEDLGYVLDGYGALDDDEITYPDGAIYMDQFNEDDNAGHLTYIVKQFYSEADEDATEEELITTAKAKVGAKYQSILNDASASDGKKAIASAALAEIENAADREEMKPICRAAEKNLRLQDAKDMAIAEVMTIAPEGKVTAEMQTVLDKAAADIQASDDAAVLEDILTKARSEINVLMREIVNFELSKEEVIEDIEALADENSSDAVKKAVANAAAAAANATSYDELSDILQNARDEVAALKDGEIPDEPTEPEAGACPYCGKTHDGIFGWIFCLINRIINMIRIITKISF